MAILNTGAVALSYSDEGPRPGAPILLLHGWPDDASAWDDVVHRLQAAGFRTITMTYRGFGESRFTDEKAPRTADPGILAMDAIALLDALGIARAFVAGHDWGSHVGEALAVGWPDRIVRLAMLSTPSRLGGLKIPSFKHAQLEWYHWFQATRIGAEAVMLDPKGFAHLMWQNWSPPGWFSEITFARVAKSFEGPDWISVTLHSYRSRWGEAAPDPASRWLEDKVKETERLALPTLYFQGSKDGVNPPETGDGMAEKFSGPFRRILMPGVGHFPTREAPADVARELIAHFSW